MSAVVRLEQAVAVEDSVPGVRSAVAAGIPVVGNVVFVPAGDRRTRRRALVEAGAAPVIESWEELAAGLLDGPVSADAS